jgi:hypothetical protein
VPLVLGAILAVALAGCTDARPTPIPSAHRPHRTTVARPELTDIRIWSDAIALDDAHGTVATVALRGAPASIRTALQHYLGTPDEYRDDDPGSSCGPPSISYRWPASGLTITIDSARPATGSGWWITGDAAAPDDDGTATPPAVHAGDGPAIGADAASWAAGFPSSRRAPSSAAGVEYVAFDVPPGHAPASAAPTGADAVARVHLGVIETIQTPGPLTDPTCPGATAN